MLARGSIRISLASRQENVALAGTAMQAIGLASGFDPQAASMLQLALEEAVTNAILHAYRGQPDRSVEVSIDLLPDRLDLVVSDRGHGMAAWPESPRESPDDPPPIMQEGGRGIYLINHIMDSVAYRTENGSNLLSMSKSRPKP